MTGTLTDLSADDLIARGIAPVKREYWKPITTRQEVTAVGSSLAQKSPAPAERKTKKKARQVQLRSALNRHPARLACRVGSLSLRSTSALLRGRRNEKHRSTSATVSWQAAANLTVIVVSVMTLKPSWLRNQRNCMGSAHLLLLPDVPTVSELVESR